MSRVPDAADQWLQANDPEYLKSSQGWKHTRGKSIAMPFEEIAVGGSSDEPDDVDDESGGNAALFSELYDPDRAILGDRIERDLDRARDKQPHRKKDRHKGSRAAYMREYRARKAAEGGS